MKYIISPIFRFLWALIGGVGWSFFNLVIILWEFSFDDLIPFDKNEHRTYSNPIDYLFKIKR